MDIKELWEDYAKKFNHLSDLMKKEGLDPKLLIAVINAAIALENFT